MRVLLSQINPVAFEIFGWPVRWYGLIIGLGIALAYLVIMIQAKHKNMDREKVSDLIFWAIMMGFVGARLYYVVFNLSYYLANPTKIVAIWEGGIAIYGGILGGLLTLVILTRRYQISLWDFLDMAVPGLLIAQILGRWGNFVNQEAYGQATSLSRLQALGLPNWLIQQMKIDGTYYQPTFLYESSWNLLGLLVLIGLVFLYKNRRRGDLTYFYLLWYGLGRFYIEGLRSDSLYWGPVRVSQALALIFVVLSIFGFLMSHRYHRLPLDQAKKVRDLS